MENILTTHNHEKGEFASSQSGGYALDFKINNASLNTQVENISLQYIPSKYSSSHHYKDSQESIFLRKKFKEKIQSGKDSLSEID